MTSGTIDNRILQSANIGYRCLYPHCQERRPDYYHLAQHVEATHNTPEEIKKMIIRDRFGNIAALPPHCLFRYNPEVGLPQHQVKEVVASVLAEDYNSNQLLSLGQTAPVVQFLEPYGTVAPQTPYARTPMGPASGALVQSYAQAKVAYTAAVQQRNSVPSQINAAQASSKKPVKLDLPLEKFYEVTKQFESPADQAAAAQSILRILVNKKRHLDQMENSGIPQPSVRTIWAPNDGNTVANDCSMLAAGATTLQKQNFLPTATAVRNGYGHVSSHTVSASVGVVMPQHSVSHRVNSVGKTVTSTVSSAAAHTVTTGTVNGSTCAVNTGYHVAAPTFARMLSVTPAHSPDSGRGSESSADDSFSNQLSPINATGAAVSTYAPSSASSRNVDDYDIDDSSNSSWTYVENYTEEMIISQSKEHAAKRMKLESNGGGGDKPYACVVPGCNKQYKNMQGIKYHAKSSAHKIRKGYRCTCGKKYATDAEYKIHTSCCPGIHSSQTSLIPGSPQSPLVFVASPQKQLSQIAPNIANTPTLQHLLSRPLETTRTGAVLPSMNSSGPLPPASVFASKGTGQTHSVLNSLLD